MDTSKYKHLSLIEILSFFSLIEKSVPKIKHFSLYIPSVDFDPKDAVSIQREAKSMMEFVGLKDYTTIVTMCSTNNGTAGNINLNNSREVFIEIDTGLSARGNFAEAVMCVIAHEICHKYLYSHGLYLEDTKENEYCTDLTTFFVGFGLLTINGCYEQLTTKGQDSNGGSTMHTRTYSIGYLSPENYLTAHQIVCKIHGFDYLKGVSPRMQGFVSTINEKQINSTQLCRESIIDKFRLQSESLANRKREIILLRNYLDLKEKELMSKYEEIDSQFNQLILYENSVEHLPFASLHVLNLSNSGVGGSEFSEMLKGVGSEYEKMLYDSLLAIKCPFCGAISTSRIKEKRLSIRKCQCGKIFYWDSRPIMSCQKVGDEDSESHQGTVSNKFSSWIKSISGLVKKS